MTNKPKRRYRIRNWPDYNKALVRRGSLTLWVEQSAVDKWRDTAAPVIDDTQIIVDVNGPPRLAQISVETPSGTATSSGSFRVIRPLRDPGL